ncbi:MAG TPA: DUF86 domain-containing protein [Firmicutes bacterium]|nr:DUF86 domain-containing protein [Bacillota bacterium]
MVNRDKIRQKLATIEANLRKLQFLKNLPSDDFLGDFRNVESAKHLLQVSIENMSDICDHIIAKHRLGTPASQAESFRMMSENGFLDPANLQRYLLMTKFRNKVVHLYFEIQDTEIYKILQTDLEDFNTFITEILRLHL